MHWDVSVGQEVATSKAALPIYLTKEDINELLEYLAQLMKHCLGTQLIEYCLGTLFGQSKSNCGDSITTADHSGKREDNKRNIKTKANPT